MAAICTRFGLLAPPDPLLRVDRAAAGAVLERLLWKDLAYAAEIMPRETAQRLAQGFLAAVPDGARFYTNGPWQQHDAVVFSPLTEATFDAGILALWDHTAACVW